MSKDDLTAVGIHVFAGGFTRGVLDAGWRVPVQLETHGFGLETTERMNGVATINEPGADWPSVPGLMAFGNPRCTAFSTITSGDKYVESNAHGAWAKQTCDIHEMCEYGAGRYDFLIWESVQQAYTRSGRDLVKYLVRDVFAPKKYRVAHLLLNAASFGNSQQRKRYFFVAYRDKYKFNVEPPRVSPFYPVLYDAVWQHRDRPTRECRLYGDSDYDADCYTNLTPDERYHVPLLPNGWCLNYLARHGYHLLNDKYKSVWDLRMSDIPFSLHTISRLNWLRPSPTMHSSCTRWIHPDFHRPLTVRELQSIMGWPDGDWLRESHPQAQLAKGIVPAVGAWLARQVELSYRGHWGRDDWQSSFDDRKEEWVGEDTTGRLEKECDLTKYVGKFLDRDRYDLDVVQRHRFNVCERTGRASMAWKEVAGMNAQRGVTR